MSKGSLANLFFAGVAVVTAEVDGNRLGATISSFNSVSIEPALVLFSLACGSPARAQWPPRSDPRPTGNRV